MSYKTLLKEVKKHPDTKFTKMLINSGGGDTVFGRKIADYIFENKLDVEVEEICFSSCANYIFPAGKNKYIQKDAFVGWHGSEVQGLFLKDKHYTFEDYEKQELKKALLLGGVQDKKELQKYVAEEYEYVLQAIAKEIQFFVNIKTNIVLTVLGHYNLDKDTPYRGWTYAIKDMKKFGLENVIYMEDEKKYPQAQEPYQDGIFVQAYDDAIVKEMELAIKIAFPYE